MDASASVSGVAPWLAASYKSKAGLGVKVTSPSLMFTIRLSLRRTLTHVTWAPYLKSKSCSKVAKLTVHRYRWEGCGKHLGEPLVGAIVWEGNGDLVCILASLKLAKEHVGAGAQANLKGQTNKARDTRS